MIKIIKGINRWGNEYSDFLTGVLIGMFFVTLILLALDKPKTKYDLNNDGVVDIKDMLIVQKYILDNEGCECNE